MTFTLLVTIYLLAIVLLGVFLGLTNLLIGTIARDASPTGVLLRQYVGPFIRPLIFACPILIWMIGLFLNFPASPYGSDLGFYALVFSPILFFIGTFLGYFVPKKRIKKLQRLARSRTDPRPSTG